MSLNPYIKAFEAGESLSSKDYRAVVLKSDGKVYLPDVAGDRCLGLLLQQPPATGINASVFLQGEGFAEANSAFSIADILNTAVDGRLQRAASSLVINPSGENNSLTFTAAPSFQGSKGDHIAITYIDPSENDQALVVTVVQNEGDYQIDISLATNSAGVITTTANQLIAAIVASAAASQVVTVANTGTDTGAGDVTAISKTYMAAVYGAFAIAFEAATAQGDIVRVFIPGGEL